jgi:hypothetical protein
MHQTQTQLQQIHNSISTHPEDQLETHPIQKYNYNTVKIPGFDAWAINGIVIN